MPYYYIHFGDRADEHCEERTPEYLKQNGKRCDDAPNNTRQTETGVTGRTILLDLYKLYKFDPIKNMTTDKMHLSFNMLKKDFLEKMWASATRQVDERENATRQVDERENTTRQVDERDPDIGG